MLLYKYFCMKKLFIIFIISILFYSGISFAADLWWYNIEWYNVDMKLNTDWSMNIKEIIKVHFSESRHGIYREIPIKDPKWEYTHITNLTSIDNPVADNTITDGNYVLKIWDADTFVSWQKTYTITYTVKNAIKIYSWWNNMSSGAWQELYWNVIWTQRNTTIKNITFSLSIPQAYTFWNWEIFVKQGLYGEENNVNFKQINDTTVIWILSGVLWPYNWITLWAKFPSQYFKIDNQYEKLFTEEPALGLWNIIKKIRNMIISSLWWWFIIVFMIITLIEKITNHPRWKIKWYTSAWKTKKAITPYYLPPINVDPAEAFWFRYNAQNPQIFVSLLYYWATRWWVHISYKEWKKYIFGITWKNQYHITETVENPKDASDLDKLLLQQFFWKTNGINNNVELNEKAYNGMNSVLWQLQWKMDNETWLYIKQSSLFRTKFTLTPKWEKLFDEMSWFREYLLKVEKPVLEKELANDPLFFNKILPWAVLFWTETRILQMCEEVLSKVWWYDSYNGTLLNAYYFHNMTSWIQSSIIPPRDSSNSWFGWGSGWGWFSWGWGGGWGWWSW